MEMKHIHSLKDMERTQWRGIEDPDFPFTDFPFLKALEDSNSLKDKSIWHPSYYLLYDEGVLQAALVTYIKVDSYGEYIFDWQWAHAYQSYGYEYYPKITSAIPFTPATGPKLLKAQTCREEQVKMLLDYFEENKVQKKASSIHHLFIPEHDIALWENRGYLLRHSYQFHWMNRNYESFEAFLATFTGKRRRQIKKERDSIGEQGIEIKELEAEQLDENWAKIFYEFYLETIYKKQGIPYLNSNFFESIFKHFRNRIIVLVAYCQDEIVGVSLSFFKGQKLYGRYWGGDHRYKNLHFELCYYRLIEWAISRKIKYFEAGAQGEHKIHRGFTPTLTYSLHKFKNPHFYRAIENYIAEEKRMVENDCHLLNKKLPFK